MVGFTFNKSEETGVKTLKLFLMDLSEGPKVVTIMDNSNRNFQEIKEGLKDGLSDDELYQLYKEGDASIQLSQELEKYRDENGNPIAVYDESTERIFYDDEEIHGSVANAIRAAANEGFPIEGHLRFLANLKQNPSYNSRNQFYEFIAQNGLTITEDGYVLMYKACDSNYDSYHKCRNTGESVNWTPGTTVKMDRSEIDDNPSSHCSAGLHVGSLGYVRGFGRPTGKVVVCKVNPRDIVSVPNDLNQKVRVCEAQILKDYDFDWALPTTSVYRDDLSEVERQYYDDWNEDDLDDLDLDYDDLDDLHEDRCGW